MLLSCEILGVPVVVQAVDGEVLIDVGGFTCSPAEIFALHVPRADVTRTVELGGFMFDPLALSAMRKIVAAGCSAARAEWGCGPRGTCVSA